MKRGPKPYEREISRQQIVTVWLRVANGDLDAISELAYWHERYPNLRQEYELFVKGQATHRAASVIQDVGDTGGERNAPLVGVRVAGPLTISQALAGSGVTLKQIQRLLVRRRKGDVHSSEKLEGLLILHPNLQVVIDSFTSGKKSGGLVVSKPKRAKKQPETPWTRMALGANPKPLPGGLPSLGKRR